MYKKEEIKDHPGYQIDTNGVVYKKNGEPFKTSINPCGYEIVTLMVGGAPRSYSVHRLVLRQFSENENDDEFQVNHIDGIKTNNRIENLEWVTAKENCQHATKILKRNVGCNNPRAKKLYGYDKKGELKVLFPSLSDAARFYSQKRNIVFERTKVQLWRVVYGLRKTCYGLVWKYE